MSDRKPLVKPEDVARDLNIGLTALYALARDGKIPSYRVGGQWRFDLDEVRAATRKAVAS